MRVRDAKARDIGLFRKLQAEYFADPENEGLLVEPDERSAEFFDALFNTCVEEDEGIALFVSDTGMLVASPLVTPTSLKPGRTANIWFAHVSEKARDTGVEEALFAEVKKRLTELRFDAVMFSTPSVGKWVAVAEEEGFEPFSLQHLLKLGGDDEQLD